MFGVKVNPKSVTIEKTGGGNHKVLAISISAVAAAVPALWLGGCLATRRPAWFLSRQTVRKMRHKAEDFRDRIDELKNRMEDVKDKFEEIRHKTRRMNARGWFASLRS